MSIAEALLSIHEKHSAQLQFIYTCKNELSANLQTALTKKNIICVALEQQEQKPKMNLRQRIDRPTLN